MIGIVVSAGCLTADNRVRLVIEVDATEAEARELLFASVAVEKAEPEEDK